MKKAICMFSGNYPECKDCLHGKEHNYFEECDDGECEVTSSDGNTVWQATKCIEAEDFKQFKALLELAGSSKKRKTTTVQYFGPYRYALLINRSDKDILFEINGRQ